VFGLARAAIGGVRRSEVLDLNHELRGLHEPALLYAEEAFAIQGAVFEVNRHMGCGFLEAVYRVRKDHRRAQSGARAQRPNIEPRF
jgi:hypothetical protein